MNSRQIKKTQELLRNWYDENRRELPWRQTDDPYRIWLSEIILQQTRVSQGLPYYLRFVEHFSDVNSLAAADEDEVLKLWQGLGYYSRARNLHRAAKIISEKHKGQFPKTFKEIIALPGIGDYTASAIASFAYNLPHAVVDGNVYRFLSRLTNDATPIDTTAGQRHFKQLAQELLPTEGGEHNQAMMEFGALHCTPTGPDCNACPFRHLCLALQANSVELLPVKQSKVKVKKRYFNYFYIEYEGKIYIRERTGNDIWKGLYEFPLIESSSELSAKKLMQEESFAGLFGEQNVSLSARLAKRKHILTHRQIFARLYRVKIEKESKELSKFLKLTQDELAGYPISRLTELLLEDLGLQP